MLFLIFAVSVLLGFPAVGLCGVLNLSALKELDPVTYQIGTAGLCLGLTKIWGELFPKLPNKVKPWVSVAVGMLAYGINGGNILQGFLTGTMASGNFDLMTSVKKGLEKIGVGVKGK